MEWCRLLFGLAPFPPEFNDFNYDTLVECGILTISGPVWVQGHTYDIAFWLGLRRRHEDLHYHGLILIWNLVYVHFTRASKRLYVLLENLSLDPWHRNYVHMDKMTKIYKRILRDLQLFLACDA